MDKREELKRIELALNLMKSMIDGGEQHSEMSIQEFDEWLYDQLNEA